MRIDLAPNSYTDSLKKVFEPGTKEAEGLENLKRLAKTFEELVPVELGGHINWHFQFLRDGTSVAIMALVFWMRADGTGFLTLPVCVNRPWSGEGFEDCANEVAGYITYQQKRPAVLVTDLPWLVKPESKS